MGVLGRLGRWATLWKRGEEVALDVNVGEEVVERDDDGVADTLAVGVEEGRDEAVVEHDAVEVDYRH